MIEDVRKAAAVPGNAAKASGAPAAPVLTE
jgi:hypothetical protein